MNDTIKGALIGAIIPTVGSFAIFFLGNFSTQDTIERNTVETLSGYFDSVNREMSYEQALQTIYKENENLKIEIERLESQFEELNKQVSDKQAEINEKNSQEKINKIIQDATTYWNRSDFIQALSLLKNKKSESSDIESLYEQYSQEYVSNLIIAADNLITEKKYDEAIIRIKEGVILVSNPDILNNKITEIEAKYPINLSQIKVSASRYFEQIQDRSIEDTIGHKHQSGNLFLLTSHDGDDAYGYTTLYLGEKYSSVSGIIAVSDESENAELDGHIEIYSKNGENYNLLYESPILTRASSPINLKELNLDLKGCEWIEIRYYNNGTYFFYTDRSLEIILSDIMFYGD